jgi:hypothetical protein
LTLMQVTYHLSNFLLKEDIFKTGSKEPVFLTKQS